MSLKSFYPCGMYELLVKMYELKKQEKSQIKNEILGKVEIFNENIL